MDRDHGRRLLEQNDRSLKEKSGRRGWEGIRGAEESARWNCLLKMHEFS